MIVLESTDSEKVDAYSLFELRQIILNREFAMVVSIL